MSLTFFDHRKRRIVQTSPSSDAHVDLGIYHTDLDSRRIGDSQYDLLFTIDTQTAFPKCKGLPPKLPIIYKTRNPDFDILTYRVREQSIVEVLTTGKTLEISGAMSAPGKPLRGVEIPYNPRKAEDALAWAGVFSLKRLSRREMQRAIQIVDKRWGDDWRPYCIVPWSDNSSKSDMLHLEWVEPFAQNASFGCPANNGCDRGFWGTPTIPLVLYDKSPDLNLFGGFNPQLIVTYCRRCYAIGVLNQAD